MRTVTVIGSINIDLVVMSERLPREGETVLGREFRVVCGGKGANQAVAAARLGARVGLVGCVGRDEYGRMAVRNLKQQGVDTREVAAAAAKRKKSSPAHTGVALIVVDDCGRNLIAVAPNANAAVRVPRRALDIAVMQLETPFAVPNAKTFILNPAPASLEALNTGRSSRRRRPLDDVDIVTPNEHEAHVLTGHDDPKKAARELLRMGAARAIITLGERGVYDSSTDRAEPAFRVKPVDTVGAGDCFVGALAAALAAGETEPVRFAQAAAALNCTRIGAQAAPRRADVRRLLERG